MKKIKDYAALYIKGAGMGMADIIPGVSGGTIAFITGIYEELIYTINSINKTAIHLLLSFQFAAFWKKINGSFIIPLLAGIGTSIALLSRLIHFLLNNYSIVTWSFFFGLITASVPLISREIKWNKTSLLMGLGGVGAAYWVTAASPVHLPSSNPIILFFCGTIAICAMILPGISGAFILLLLGQYKFLIYAISNFDIISILSFIAGCVLGLFLFSRLLNRVLTYYRFPTLALLSGFTLGSLNKLWPWKNVITFRVNSKGEQVPFISKNLWPTEYLSKTGQDPQILHAILLASLAVSIVIFVDRFSGSLKTKL